MSSAFCLKGYENAYFDIDNSAYILEERGYDKIIEDIQARYGNKFLYINGDMLDNPKVEVMGMLEEIKNNASKGSYAKCAFFFDSFKFFLNGGVYDTVKIAKFAEFAKTIRRCGGTVWILHHSLKNSDTMQGAQDLTDAVDEQWELLALGQDEKESHYVLRPTKYRMKVAEVGYTVNRITLEMKSLDPLIAAMTDQEREFVDKVKVALEKQSYNQNALLQELGIDHGDRFGRETLAKYSDKFWKLIQNGTKKIYEKLDTADTPTH